MFFFHPRIVFPTIVLLLAAGMPPAHSAPKKHGGDPAATAAAPAVPLEATPEGRGLRNAWEKAQYRFTPEVRTAYLAFAKAEAQKELVAAGRTLPADFLAWVDGEPVVATTVYGASASPAGTLLLLRSLELDLGTEAVRKTYTPLALVMAVEHARAGLEADITPRGPLTLVIPPCPLKPVDTHPTDRPLDVNDHIINFFEGRTFTEEVKIGRKDEHGKKVTATETRTRPLAACDVMASQKLQDEFNAYMKAKGQTVEIHCGDHVIYPDRHDAVHGPEGKEILKAFHLFKSAYEAKGLLPAQRDPTPSPAETCAFLIRNDAQRFPAEAKRQWPRFPLNAPWPVLVYLARNRQPLRECEDIWERYRDKGEFHGYGEYIGGIAQQFDFQSARRLRPYPFAYGTIQMMFKDGGVCGTMANIATRSHLILGEPASTAGQPGHCALVRFRFDAKSGTYELVGGQFVTGGPEKTTPHAEWTFGGGSGRRPMVYHQSVGWAVNHGLQAYLDSMMAHALFRALPEADRQAHGLELLESGLALNPYNFVLVDAAQAVAGVEGQMHLWNTLQPLLAAAAKPGCPADGLYNRTVRDNMCRALERLPVPAEAAKAREVWTFLQGVKCDNQELLAKYEAATEGVPALLARMEADLKAHLASGRNEDACGRMAAAVKAAAARIADKKQRKEWAHTQLDVMRGHEAYLGKKDRITTDEAAVALTKLAGAKLPGDADLVQPVLDGLAAVLTESTAGERTHKACAALAKRLVTVAGQIADSAQKRRWLDGLAKAMAGHETFMPKGGGKKAKPQRDPCADAIGTLLASAGGAPSAPAMPTPDRRENPTEGANRDLSKETETKP
jgi:hypothetical protein